MHLQSSFAKLRLCCLKEGGERIRVEVSYLRSSVAVCYVDFRCFGASVSKVL